MTVTHTQAEVDCRNARPGARAHYLAALAVGLASAAVPDHVAVAELTDAVGGRHGDAVAARRRLYASSLGSCESRREAARLLDIVSEQTRPRPRLAHTA